MITVPRVRWLERAAIVAAILAAALTVSCVARADVDAALTVAWTWAVAALLLNIGFGPPWRVPRAAATVDVPDVDPSGLAAVSVEVFRSLGGTALVAADGSNVEGHVVTRPLGLFGEAVTVGWVSSEGGATITLTSRLGMWWAWTDRGRNVHALTLVVDRLLARLPDGRLVERPAVARVPVRHR